MTRSLISLLVALMFPVFAHAESLVVIAVTGDEASLSPGAIVESEDNLKLSDGVSVTFLSKGGQVVTFRGPYNDIISGLKDGGADADNRAWGTTLTSIGDAISKKVARTKVVGSSRQVDAPVGDAHDDIWLLTVDSSGHRCLPPEGAEMWRKDASKSVEMDLRSQSARQKGMIWPAGKNTTGLPQKFVEDGTLVVMKIDTLPRRFNIHVLPKDIEKQEWGHILHWMIASECSRQAALLIDMLHSGEIDAQ